MLLYHYTNIEKAKIIFKMGELLPSWSEIEQFHNIRPGLWFTGSGDLDVKELSCYINRIPVLACTVENGVKILRYGSVNNDIPLIRFVFNHDADFCAWKNYKRLGRLSHEVFSIMHQRHLLSNNFWGAKFICFKPLPLTKCVAFEIYKEGAWVPYLIRKNENKTISERDTLLADKGRIQTVS